MAETLKRLQSLCPNARCLVLWFRTGAQPEVLGAHGFDADRVFTTEALSVSLLENTVKRGEVRWSGNTDESELSTTFVLAGIKSFLSVPIRAADGTLLLYADDQQRVARFSYTDVINVQNLGRQTVRPLAPPKPPPPPKVEPQLVLRLDEQVNLLRSLSTLMDAGIPLLHGLGGLARSGESPRLRALAARLQARLLQGNYLSAALPALARIDGLAVALLKSAERSGQLAAVLRLLTEHLEEVRQRLMRLRSALVYPLTVLAGSLLLALFLPTFVLRDQLASYESVPWPTAVLIAVGGMVGDPRAWVVAALASWLLFRSLPALRPYLHRACLALPGLRRLACARTEVVLATTLALQLEAGVPLLAAVELALQACQSPPVDLSLPGVLAALRNGDPLHRALAQVPGVRRTFRLSLAAGEEVGRAAQTLRWTARLARLEFDSSLDAAMLLFEPVAIVLMGLVVGTVAVGSLLPSLQMLQTL